MITPSEMMKIAMLNPNYNKAREILLARGLDFKTFSCDNEIIEMLINKTGEEREKLIDAIEKANRLEKDVHEILAGKIYEEENAKGLENFFKAFENPNTKERLFLVVGETGVGKTYAITERYPDIPFYACNKELDPYSLCYYLTDKDGSGNLRPHETPFLKALKNGGKVFLDEINELPHATLMLLQGITDEKKTVVVGDEVVTIHQNFKIIAAMNPPSETDERTPLGDAILGRAVGFIMELTDEIIMERLGVTKKWLDAVRRLWLTAMRTGFEDMRELNFRDYQKFVKYGVEQQLRFKIAVGDVKNIRDINKVMATGEYQELLNVIKEEQKNNVRL